MHKNKKQRIAAAVLGCALSLASPTKANPSDAESTLNKQGCLHCHSIDGEGGMIGPPLDDIGKFRSAKFIENKLSTKAKKQVKSKKIYPEPTDLMNHVILKKDTAKLLADYLVNHKSKSHWSIQGHGTTESEEVPLGSSFSPHSVSKDSREGFSLYKEKGCAACHSINLIGGRFGPPLDGVGARRSRKFIENRISAGATVSYGDKEYKPSSYSMPSMNLSQKEVRLLSEFLLTLPVKNNH